MYKSFLLRFFFSTKKLYYGDIARRRLLKGINEVCKATQLTLGPKVTKFQIIMRSSIF